MKLIFLGEYRSKQGVECLIISVKIVFDNLSIENVATKKLIGLTTILISADTDKNNGFWVHVHMKQYSGRDLLCIWCVADRSDLAMPVVESSIIEVHYCKSNIKSVAASYTTSTLRFEKLNKKAETENQTAT